MFDTGSFLFWVRDRKCMDKHQNFCSGLASYDKNKSTSYRGPGKAIKQIEYADGAKVNGNKAIEMISVGGLSVKNQDFTQAVSFNHHMSEQDGIMGLGISSPDQIMFFRNLFNQKHIKSPIYSYHLDANDLNGGLTFGAIDTARYDGSLLWVPVAYRAEYVGQHWGLSVYNLKVSNSEIKVSRDVEILLDTGTSLGVFPSALAERINFLLGMTPVPGKKDHWSINCSLATNMPLINITLSTGILALSSKEYIYKSGNVCRSAITGGSQDENTIIFGNALMRRFYMVYDFKAFKIGFAVANRATNISSNFVETDSSNPPAGSWKHSGFREVYPSGSNRTKSLVTNNVCTKRGSLGILQIVIFLLILL
jgi:hypothetical protein